MENFRSTIRIMTFNIRGCFFTIDGKNIWENRAELNVKTIQRYAPDVIGFQELQSGNLMTYQEQLTSYQHILGPKAENKEPHNYNAIFWNSSRYESVDSGGFWLSKTPDRHSSDWSTQCIRAANWVKLRCLYTGLEFIHLNTHLDHFSELARLEGSKLILEKLPQIQSDTEVIIITGDFNCGPGSNLYNIFVENNFIDVYLDSGNSDSEASNTYHGFQDQRHLQLDGQKNLGRIDWILVRGNKHNIQVNSCYIIHDQCPPVYPSDHYPVLAELEITHSYSQINS